MNSSVCRKRVLFSRFYLLSCFVGEPFGEESDCTALNDDVMRNTLHSRGTCDTERSEINREIEHIKTEIATSRRFSISTYQQLASKLSAIIVKHCKAE